METDEAGVICKKIYFIKVAPRRESMSITIEEVKKLSKGAL